MASELEKYKRLIDNIPAVTWITDRNGNTEFISSSVTNIYGYTPEEVHRAGPEIWLDHIHEHDRHRVLKAFDELFSAGIPFDITYRIRHKDGHWVWLLDKALATFRENDIDYAYGVLFDVTNQKEVELRLRLQEKRFEDLVTHSTDWIWEFDENEIFTYSSPRIKDLLGYQPDEVIGKSAFSFLPPPEAERVRNEFQPVKDARQPFSNLPNINQHKDGHLVTIESSGVPIIDAEGRFRGYRGIDRDISERKILEARLRQMQKMEAMGTLAGGIAHDFNNILAALLGYAEMLKREIAPTGKAWQHLGQVLKAGQRAKNLVSQILSFTREVEQERRPLQLHHLVAEVERFLRATLPSSIAIVKQLETEDDVILADPTQIHQVLMNLCTNAAQAMELRGGTLTIGIAEAQVTPAQQTSLLPGHYIKLTVADTGGGIEPTIVNRIFDPYFTTKPIGEGTGLGLSVVHGIVQSYRGEISLTNQPGHGAIFDVLFPRLDASTVNEELEPQSLPPGRGRILFIDDEASIANLHQELLSDLGYQVITLTSSLKALELFKANPQQFDLVITDQTMPQLPGDQLATQILNIRPEIPIILCTGHSSQIDPDKASALGIKAFLYKPIELSRLATVIQQILGAEKEKDLDR